MSIGSIGSSLAFVYTQQSSSFTSTQTAKSSTSTASTEDTVTLSSEASRRTPPKDLTKSDLEHIKSMISDSGSDDADKLDQLIDNFDQYASTDGTISTVDGTVTIPAGYTTGGTVQISEAEQGKVIPGNIKSGATILGVAGKDSVVDTDDADATAGDILSGKTAYVNGQKVTGTTTMPTISLLDGVLSIS